MNDKTNPEVNLNNDVQTIRNILMGEHLERFQERLTLLEKKINQLENENVSMRKSIEAKIDQRIQDLSERTDQMNSLLEQTAKDQTNALQKVIKDFEAKLQEIRNKQSSLIGSLAQALTDYQKKSGK